MNEQAIQNLITFLCLLPLFLVSLPAMFVVQEALLPNLLTQARVRLTRAPGRSLLVGLVNGAFFFFLVVVLGSSGLGLLALLGVFVLAALFLLVVIGFGAMAGTIGSRVFELWERPAPPIVRLLAGSVTLEGLLFVPVLGWLALATLGLSGFGAVLATLWRRWRRDAQSE